MMRKNLLLFATMILSAACGRNANVIGGVFVSVAHMEGANVIPVNVSCGYVNEPCVSVTVCDPNGNNCQTVDNVLLDTGSYGLRVFASAVQNVGLTSVNYGGGQLAQCQTYLDNSADWGPVVMAKVQLGTEKTTQAIPIQLIDASFPGAKSAGCTNPDDTPTNAGFNGILGVGPHIADCGSGCTSANQVYFSCSSSGTCTGAGVPEAQQVSNPVAFMPTDNNGISIILPALDLAGDGGAQGYLILGIDTSTNNKSNNSLTFIPSQVGTTFTTKFEGHTYSASFIDSGSNGLFFPQTDTGMATDSVGFFNPARLTAFTAIFNVGANNYSVGFNILPSSIAFSGLSPNLAFNDVGAVYPLAFDWGLPFFFGRTVYVGIEGKTSNLGTGPYWAF